MMLGKNRATKWKEAVGSESNFENDLVDIRVIEIGGDPLTFGCNAMDVEGILGQKRKIQMRLTKHKGQKSLAVAAVQPRPTQCVV